MKKTENMNNVITVLRTVIIVLSFILIVVAMLFSKTDFNGVNFHTEQYVVSSGDTLWSIGKECVGEEVDVREWISEVKKLNNIDSNIYPGQVIVVYVNN